MRAVTRLAHADASDALAIAALHTESWRDAYRSLLPDTFLDGLLFEDRLAQWTDRLGRLTKDEALVLKALDGDETLAGFACVLVDAEPAWGPRLDNLHVRPGYKGRAIGAALLRACLEWVARRAPGEPMHLWVLDGNLRARRFYEREGGVARERIDADLAPGVRVTEVRYVWAPGRVAIP